LSENPILLSLPGIPGDTVLPGALSKQGYVQHLIFYRLLEINHFLTAPKKLHLIL